MPDRNAFASTSVARHLTRGAIGFGLIGAALTLTPSVGPVVLLLAPLGMVALRGCPTCWIAGLIQTISAGRLERTCTDAICTLRPSTPSPVRPRAVVPWVSARLEGTLGELDATGENFHAEHERADHPELAHQADRVGVPPVLQGSPVLAEAADRDAP
jgi:hypothetical protein